MHELVAMIHCPHFCLPSKTPIFSTPKEIDRKKVGKREKATANLIERWGAGVETQIYVRGDIGGWGRVPFNETYAPSLSTIYDGA